MAAPRAELRAARCVGETLGREELDEREREQPGRAGTELSRRGLMQAELFSMARYRERVAALYERLG